MSDIRRLNYADSKSIDREDRIDGHAPAAGRHLSRPREIEQAIKGKDEKEYDRGAANGAALSKKARRRFSALSSSIEARRKARAGYAHAVEFDP